MEVEPTETTVSTVEPMEVDVSQLNNSENHPPTEQQLESENVIETAQAVKEGNSGEPASVSQFRVLLGMEMARLSSAKSAWEDVIEEEERVIPEIGIFLL